MLKDRLGHVEVTLYRQWLSERVQRVGKFLKQGLGLGAVLRRMRQLHGVRAGGTRTDRPQSGLLSLIEGGDQSVYPKTRWVRSPRHWESNRG